MTTTWRCCENLQKKPLSESDQGAAKALGKLIDRRQSALQKEALALGERLYADKPKHFTRQLRAHWEKWHRSDRG